MSHITRGSRNDHRNYDENLLISSSMKEDLSTNKDENLLVSSSMKEDLYCPRCKDTKLVESNIPEVGNEECYYCKEISEEQANIIINELKVFNAFVDCIEYDGNFQNFIKDKERTLNQNCKDTKLSKSNIPEVDDGLRHHYKDQDV